ncbi:TonB-dependent receptor domain-containing protein [Hylemonella gracilis]|uniref:TonB-dependent receptor domain-containing protein n=1 Tax=Hylemonella gracilis TaxID=80880 RepID=UPI001F603CA8|nr:TonB-dependent receptor [Hylemonella gracilis]
MTATRTESRVDAVLSDITVITRDDIEQGTGRTVAELLARVAGVQMSSNGGLGKTSSIFIRGTESRHVLLLVDGVRVGSASTGTPNFDSIPLESIERIEVLKGPASALYGSDAVGGVIQIFTRQGREGFFPYASATVGSAGRREASAGLSGGSGDVSYSLGVQTLREDGFSATNSSVGSSHNSDRDGVSQQSVNASADWRFAPGWKFDAHLLHADGVNNYDSGTGSYDTHADVLTQGYAVGLEGRMVPNWKSRLAYGGSDDNSTNHTGSQPTRFDTHQDQWTWLNEIGTPLGLLLLGMESIEQQVSGTTAYTVDHRTTDSVFAGLNGEAGAHGWQFNVRRDDNSQFGEANTGFAGYGYKLASELRAHVSYGTSFKAPSFNQLYYPNYGNTTTQPEEGRNREAGLAYTPGTQTYQAVYFDNRIKGFITTQPAVANIPRARIQGWTLSYTGQFDALDLHATLDLLDARNEVTGKQLRRRADEQLALGADHRVGAWKYGATVLAASERYDDDKNTVELPAYATLDIHADYALNPDWSVQARLNNLADKEYQTANGYNQPGRAVYLTLRWAPR